MNILDSLGSSSPQTGGETVCSRKGCRSRARWQVLWNNPKIHDPERRKVWLACDEHRDWLRDFLQMRGFWKDTIPLQHDTSEGTD